MRVHKGRISVQSVVGEGTVFTLDIWPPKRCGQLTIQPYSHPTI
jgi:hypothetical protein